MCGIAGVFGLGGHLSGEQLGPVVERMARALKHRGPDDYGVWADPSAGVALGHSRLSILDLSPSGHQPMHSNSGRYAIVFNGEIYNYLDLRSELVRRGHAFRGQSDTEVLLATIEEWGLVDALPRLNGMFAMALWDAAERALVLARDRFGEKPLYYGLFDKTLLFGSELKALRAHPSFEWHIDRSALAQFLRYSYVPAPRTIFDGVRKLPPASWMRISSQSSSMGSPRSFWSLQGIACAAQDHRFTGTEEDAVRELDSVLRRSVKLRMVADVPLGAFLSGGIDSSTVVALMQAQSERPIQTFSIGFREASYNEANWAKAVASHLGTNHTELYVTPAEARAVIPSLPSMYDEPFADSSQIPTFLVSALARRHVTVALSGDGGDELFGGYVRYSWAESLWRPLSLLPAQGRALLASALSALPPSAIDRYMALVDHWLPQRLRQRSPADKLQKIINLLEAETRDDVYFHLVSTWQHPETVVHTKEATHEILQGDRLPLDDFTERMMCADALTYLPDDILVKLDRAAMAVSLETRVPMLDPTVAELAWSFPRGLKFRHGKGKWILREVLAQYVPPALFERPKMGFGMPVGSWLRGPLRDWAESYLDRGRLQREGYLDPHPVREKWTAHLERRTDAAFPLWAVLIFQSWLDDWRRQDSGRQKAGNG
jgi:asparagine synthase (glutamine-hydrolysing)